MRPPRLMLLERAPGDAEWLEALRDVDPTLLCTRLEGDLGGVWTDYTPRGEILRIGHPTNAQTGYFRIFEPREGQHTAASIVLERTIFAQGITDVVCTDRDALRVAAHALARSDVYLWPSHDPVRPARALDAPPAPPDRNAMIGALRERMTRR